METVVLATIQKQIDAVLELDAALSGAFELAWERSELGKIEASLELQNEQLQKNNTLRETKTLLIFCYSYNVCPKIPYAPC